MAATILAENCLLGLRFSTSTPQGEFKERGLHWSVLTQSKHHSGDEVSTRRALTGNASLPAQAPKHECETPLPQQQEKGSTTDHIFLSFCAQGTSCTGQSSVTKLFTEKPAVVVVISLPGYANQRGPSV